MNFNGQIPPELFFEKPQYNTWIELNHNQTQAGVMRYAKSILEIGLPAGILMIDAMWSDFFGSFIFHTGRFPDARKMISELHDMGPIELSMNGNKSQIGLPRQSFNHEISDYLRGLCEPYGTKIIVRKDGLLECEWRK